MLRTPLFPLFGACFGRVRYTFPPQNRPGVLRTSRNRLRSVSAFGQGTGTNGRCEPLVGERGGGVGVVAMPFLQVVLNLVLTH